MNTAQKESNLDHSEHHTVSRKCTDVQFRPTVSYTVIPSPVNINIMNTDDKQQKQLFTAKKKFQQEESKLEHSEHQIMSRECAVVQFKPSVYTVTPSSSSNSDLSVRLSVINKPPLNRSKFINSQNLNVPDSVPVPARTAPKDQEDNDGSLSYYVAGILICFRLRNSLQSIKFSLKTYKHMYLNSQFR